MNRSIEDVEHLIENINVNMSGFVQVESLLNRFEQVKHQLPAEKRKQLRIRLISLSETHSGPLKEVLKKFADSAFQPAQGNIYSFVLREVKMNAKEKKTSNLLDISKVRQLIQYSAVEQLYENQIRLKENMILSLLQNENRNLEAKLKIENLRQNISILVARLTEKIILELVISGNRTRSNDADLDQSEYI